MDENFRSALVMEVCLWILLFVAGSLWTCLLHLMLAMSLPVSILVSVCLIVALLFIVSRL